MSIFNKTIIVLVAAVMATTVSPAFAQGELDIFLDPTVVEEANAFDENRQRNRKVEMLQVNVDQWPQPVIDRSFDARALHAASDATDPSVAYCQKYNQLRKEATCFPVKHSQFDVLRRHATQDDNWYTSVIATGEFTRCDEYWGEDLFIAYCIQDLP